MSSSFKISLDYIQEGLFLSLTERRPKTLYEISKEEAENNGEAAYQLTEGYFYDFKFSDDSFSFIQDSYQIVQAHMEAPHLGTLAPNIFVGTLTLKIQKDEKEKGSLKLEVRSVKTNYRKDYREMLEYITERCTDLVLRANSPVTQSLEVDPDTDNETLYQRFAFIRSIISTDDFKEAVNRILTYPVTRWESYEEKTDISKIRKFSQKNIRELTQGSNRSQLPTGHYLKNMGIESVPLKMNGFKKTDSADTPENRFVKHALESFLQFINQINRIAGKKNYSQLVKESELLGNELELHLNNDLFNEVSRPNSLNLNSPALQRKEGYREVLRVWLLFDLAAKLVWKGGDDVYEGGKKDVAVLYEYWLFFKLLELLESIFKISPNEIENLIETDESNLSLKIKQGRYIPLSGVYDSGFRKLNVKFSYNRSFSKRKAYPKPGSWTNTLRPDYTLTIWPFGISETKAESQELIVHIHFDAKYKVKNLTEIIPEEPDDDDELDINLNQEKENNRKGIYKNADLLKMHAYKDAIRRTGGAYVLYPGEKNIELKGFHEIIPGLGAFPVRPSKNNDGTADLKKFILEVVEHFLNRTSQREKQAFHTYDTHREPPEENFVKEPFPEYIGKNRGLFPDETYVIVGFYESEVYLKWYEKHNLYNLRTGTRSGSFSLDQKSFKAKYLLLHGPIELVTGRLYRIWPEGPKIFSAKDLIKKDYPNPEPKGEFYLVYSIDNEIEDEFKEIKFDIRNLEEHKTGRGSAEPFTVKLSDLMNAKVKQEPD